MRYEVEVTFTVEADDEMVAWDMVESQVEHALDGAHRAFKEFEMVGVREATS